MLQQCRPDYTSNTVLRLDSSYMLDDVERKIAIAVFLSRLHSHVPLSHHVCFYRLVEML